MYMDWLHLLFTNVRLTIMRVPSRLKTWGGGGGDIKEKLPKTKGYLQAIYK